MALAALLLPAIGCTVAPGYALARRLRWGAAETLVASVGASLVLVYLASFAIFASGIDLRWNWLVTALGWGMTAWYARELCGVVRRARTLCAAGLLVVAWALLLQCCVRNYSGAGWVQDWLEHWERARFFRRELPLNWVFIKHYALPARPPMMNVLSAFAMAHTGTRFDAHQLVMAALNALAFLPCALFVPRFTRRRGRGRRGVWLLAGVLAASPVFTEQTIFVWTKLLSAFYVLLALHLYLRGWERQARGRGSGKLNAGQDGRRFVASFVAMGAALLVHYSAGPYALLLGLHYAFYLVWRGRRAVAKLAAAVLLPAALLATWAGWSAHVYGLRETVSSNTSVIDAEQFTPMGNLEKVLYNIGHTIVPHPLIVPRADFDRDFNQNSRMGYVRDYLFFIYQTNLLGAFGLIGWIGLAWVLWREVWPGGEPARRARGPGARFWRWFLPAVFVLGIAVHGNPSEWGLMHICLTPVVLLGLTLLAVRLPALPRGLRLLVIAGVAVDFVLGVWINVRAQGWVPTIEPTPDGRGIWVQDAGSLSIKAALQYRMKERDGLVFAGDELAGALPALWILVAAGGGVTVILLGQESLRGTRRKRPDEMRPA